MSVIRFPRMHSVRTISKNVNDAMEIVGEPCIILSMYNPIRDKDAKRCSHCFDDVYKDSSSSACPYCYGTTFEGGVKKSVFTYAIISDSDSKETQGPHGVRSPGSSVADFGPNPLVMDHDYLIRVGHRTEIANPDSPNGYDFLSITNVKRNSLRDGMRPGDVIDDSLNSDVVSQSASLSRVLDSHPIKKWNSEISNIDVDASFPSLIPIARRLL